MHKWFTTYYRTSAMDTNKSEWLFYGITTLHFRTEWYTCVLFLIDAHFSKVVQTVPVPLNDREAGLCRSTYVVH